MKKTITTILKPLCSSFFSLFLIIFLLSSSMVYAQAIDDPLYPFHPNQSVSFASSNLPIVIISLNERMADKEEDRRVEADMTVIYRTDGARNSISDSNSSNLSNKNIINYHGKIGIKYRGNSSYYHSDKKPFGLRTQNASGSKMDADILGMGADSDWALLAPYSDRSMIRDVLTFDLCRGYLEYVPTGKYCEVVLNGIYQGVYIMAARVRRGAHRLDIPKPGSSDDALTGGYLLEIDRADEPGFRSRHRNYDKFNDVSSWHYFQYKYPDDEDFNEDMGAQRDYIISRVHQFENIMAGDHYANPDSGYRRQLDVTSALDYILAQEITHNIDAYRLSTPMYKYRDSKDPRFKFSIWDFNIAMGNASYRNGWSPEGWSWNEVIADIPFWFHKLLNDTIFKEELHERWAHYRNTNLSAQNVNGKIDSLVLLLQEAEKRNSQAWNRWHAEVWPNYYISSSWTEEIGFLRDWLHKRLQWMDSQMVKYPKNVLANASFDSDHTRADGSNEIFLSNWDTTGCVSLTSMTRLDGNYSLAFHGNGEARQAITKIENGKYLLKVWVKTEGDPQAKIAIRHFSKSDSIIMIPIDPNEQFYQIEIDDIEIQSQCCEIAFIADFTDDGTTRLYIDKVAFFHEKSAGAKPSPTTPRREITVYPNPFSQQLTFEYIPENERQQITIYTITGIVIDQFEKNVTPCIPATIHRQLPVSLPSGIYIYRILDGESVISGRIVRG